MLPSLRQVAPSLRPRSKLALQLNRILVSNEERKAARLSYANIEKGLAEFHQNGLVILENAVGHRSIEHIHSKMLQDFAKHRVSLGIRWNQGRAAGNISQSLPTCSEYLHEDIWANRLGVDMMKHIIGPKPQLSLATSNIVLPKTKGRQAVHSDYYCSHFNFPVFLEVNVYLHDVDTNNGATEFWLGTHEGYSKSDHSTATAGWIKTEVFTERAKVCPPIQPAIPRGSLMIRDLRCWHAGRENHTGDPRIILGFMYSPIWFGSHMRMALPCSAKPKLAAWDHIDCMATTAFVGDDYDYLSHCQSINLTQRPLDGSTPHARNYGPIKVTSRDYWTPSCSDLG